MRIRKYDVYSLNLFGYLNKNPQLQECLKWNKKFINQKIIDEANPDVSELLNNKIVKYLYNKDKRLACDFIRAYLIAYKNDTYKCFLDLDAALLNNDFVDYDCIKANIISVGQNHVSLAFIKGIDLCKYIVSYISNNYKTYLNDSELFYECHNYYGICQIGNFTDELSKKYYFSKVVSNFNNVLIKPTSSLKDYIEKKDEPYTVWVPSNINTKEKLIKYLGWEPNIIE